MSPSARTATEAAVLRSPGGEFALEPLRLPPPEPDEVLVRVAGAGMCHTDLLPRRNPAFGAPPVVLGHEASGIVEQVGGAVQHLSPGDHVVASFAFCGMCPACGSGRPSYCERFWPLNFSARPSGSALAVDAAGDEVASRWFGQSSFASHAVVATRSLVRVDPDLPLPMLAPLGCGVLTGAASILEALRVPRGASVVVVGTGSVGLSAVMAARLAGAGRIAAVDRDEGRLALAAELGAHDRVLVDGGAAPGPQLRDLVPRGFDYCLDTTGVPEVIAEVVDALAATGVCGLVGAPRGALTLSPTALATGRTVRGLLFGDADPQVSIPRLIRHWRDGEFPFDRLVSTYRLSEINDAERDTTSGRAVKAVLLPDR